MESSRKFSLIFEAKQAEFKRVHWASEFAKVLRNLQFSESRFDSRVKPLMRMFRLLPVCIDTLSEISSGADAEDAAWAVSLLQSWSGDEGYSRLVTAAVVADALMAMQPALRLEDAACADYALSGPAAAELRQHLHALLVEGGLFLPQASETMTHAVLRAIRGRVVFVRAGTRNVSAVSLHWRAPGAQRRAPMDKAKESPGVL